MFVGSWLAHKYKSFVEYLCFILISSICFLYLQYLFHCLFPLFRKKNKIIRCIFSSFYLFLFFFYRFGICFPIPSHHFLYFYIIWTSSNTRRTSDVYARVPNFENRNNIYGNGSEWFHQGTYVFICRIYVPSYNICTYIVYKSLLSITPFI